MSTDSNKNNKLMSAQKYSLLLVEHTRNVLSQALGGLRVTDDQVARELHVSRSMVNQVRNSERAFGRAFFEEYARRVDSNLKDLLAELIRWKIRTEEQQLPLASETHQPLLFKVESGDAEPIDFKYDDDALNDFNLSVPPHSESTDSEDLWEFRLGSRFDKIRDWSRLEYRSCGQMMRGTNFRFDAALATERLLDLCAEAMTEIPGVSLSWIAVLFTACPSDESGNEFPQDSNEISTTPIWALVKRERTGSQTDASSACEVLYGGVSELTAFTNLGTTVWANSATLPVAWFSYETLEACCERWLSGESSGRHWKRPARKRSDSTGERALIAVAPCHKSTVLSLNVFRGSKPSCRFSAITNRATLITQITSDCRTAGASARSRIRSILRCAAATQEFISLLTVQDLSEMASNGKSVQTLPPRFKLNDNGLWIEKLEFRAGKIWEWLGRSSTISKPYSRILKSILAADLWPFDDLKDDFEDYTWQPGHELHFIGEAACVSANDVIIAETGEAAGFSTFYRDNLKYLKPRARGGKSVALIAGHRALVLNHFVDATVPIPAVKTIEKGTQIGVPFAFVEGKRENSVNCVLWVRFAQHLSQYDCTKFLEFICRKLRDSRGIFRPLFNGASTTCFQGELQAAHSNRTGKSQAVEPKPPLPVRGVSGTAANNSLGKKKQRDREQKKQKRQA